MGSGWSLILDGISTVGPISVGPGRFGIPGPGPTRSGRPCDVYHPAIHQEPGKYVFADILGRLYVGDLHTGAIERQCLAGVFIKGIGQDAHNELYVLGSSNIGPTGTCGEILEIRPSAP